MTTRLRTIARRGDPPVQSLNEADGLPAPFVYFAYGSNMLTARLRDRVASAKPLGIATLPGRELRFHKDSKDGSGKCDAFAVDGGAGVVGVLFDVAARDRAALDRAEGCGAGYDDAVVTVLDAEGRKRAALTYIAHPDYIDDGLRPYSWYKDFVVYGSHEHRLPSGYIAEWIESVEAIADPDRSRDARERAKLGG